MLLNIKTHPNFKRIFFFCTVALLLFEINFWKALYVYGQNTGSTTSTGLKYFKNYTPIEYNGHHQNWAVVQDKRGILYVGNHSGIKEFDGVSWRQIDVPNFTVYSLTLDETGIVYVGGNDEIGYLAPDAKGALQYVSLLEHLEVNKRSFSNVWETHWTKQGIYFRTSKFLFWLVPNSNKIKTCELGSGYRSSFICRGTLFIRQDNVGLMKMDTSSNSFKLVPGGEKFAKKMIYMISLFEKNFLLIGTRENGFYKYDGIKAVSFPTEADYYLKEKKLSHGIRLSSGDFALATLLGGLVIIDVHGRLKEIFNRAYGLQDDNVKYVFQDFQGNLLLALSKGISKIEYVSPISIYDERSNLPGNVQAVMKHQKHLYVGTDRGLFFLDPSYGFRPAAGISSNCWALLSIEDSALAATTDGVFQVENNIKQRVIKNPSYVLLRSPKDANRIWVGTLGGLVSLNSKNKNGKCTEEHKFENIIQEIETMVEDKKGNLWLGTKTQGVLKIDFPGAVVNKNPVVTCYHTSHGLPEGPVRAYTAAGNVIFATNQGIFRFDKNNNNFIPDLTLGEVFAGAPQGKWVFRVIEDKNKNIWLYSEAGIIQAIPQPDKTFVLNKKPFLKIPKTQVNAIYPGPDGDSTWFASNDGLIRYDNRVKKNYHFDFPTLVRKILVNGNLVFNGYKYKELFPIIPYKDRNLRFEYAAPFFEAEISTRYQCFLEGYERDWSDWSSETGKDYTNLDNGLYTFRVRAQNVYENLSKEAVFQFKILPPWYKTWWAYLFYTSAIFLAVFFIVKWSSGKLQREKQRLEKIVKERTKEIEDKNLQLENKTAQLEEQSEKLKEMDKVKSRFFANISHEFRTPLTLIMGPLEQMIAKTKNYQRKDQLNLMLRNSQRLLTLINQLLDLSRFDSGEMRLQASPRDIIAFLKGILASFRPLAAQKKLELEFVTGEENITIYFDPGKMEEAICNLLSNSVKFTRPGGKITVTAKVSGIQTEEEKYPSGFLEISVRDTGEGISKDQLIHIFDRFYQATGSELQGLKHKGSGIGLALTKEVVNLHHGRINVHSSEGKGSEFIIRLPMGNRHLNSYEIVSPSEIPASRRKSCEIRKIRAADIIAEKKSEPVTVDEDVWGDESGIQAPGKEKDEDKEPEIREREVILVVEDHAEVRDYIRGSLEPQYMVVEAENGRAGIKKAKEIIPDLIISDIMMPEVDGYQLCRVLKKEINTSHIPIILLTAKASEESIVHGLETGADDYITKPFSTKILTARIKNLIDLRRQLQLKIQREKDLMPAEISVSPMDQGFLKEFQGLVEKNLSDPDFSIHQLCNDMIMSRATLFRKIYALTGQTPNQFIQSYRLQRAAQLLKANFGNVTEVAFEVGFSSSAYFTKCFKEKFHQLPSTFQACK